jgi:hypothetical protein
MTDFVCIKHPDVEGVGRIPRAALAGWQPRGWVECDPPEEIDPTTAHRPKPEPPKGKQTPKTQEKTNG